MIGLIINHVIQFAKCLCISDFNSEVHGINFYKNNLNLLLCDNHRSEWPGFQSRNRQREFILHYQNRNCSGASPVFHPMAMRRNHCSHTLYSGLVGCSAVLDRQIPTYRRITVLSSSRSSTPRRPPVWDTPETIHPTTCCSISVDLKLQHHCKNLKYRTNRLPRLKLYETSGSTTQL
jgi:hypothetical protein